MHTKYKHQATIMNIVSRGTELHAHVTYYADMIEMVYRSFEYSTVIE